MDLRSPDALFLPSACQFFRSPGYGKGDGRLTARMSESTMPPPNTPRSPTVTPDSARIQTATDMPDAQWKRTHRPGFRQDDWNRLTDEFSGLADALALAKLLLQQPNLLLLDEPTNHLDLEARNWLEEYLVHYPNAFV